MTKSIFKKAIFISLLGHITVFSIFGFSFGHRIPKADFASVYFWGAILRNSDLMNKKSFNTQNIKKTFVVRPHTSSLDKAKNERPLITAYYFLKPPITFTLKEDKIIFGPKSTSISFIRRRNEQVIMFHPSMPHHFLIFFKDRQTVHIELMYNIISRGRTDVITIKRKISSGNLEADLLTMRYIGHYLFIGQARFVTDNWQTLRIDLSAKND